MTVGELKRLLETYEDDDPVMVYTYTCESTLFSTTALERYVKNEDMVEGVQNRRSVSRPNALMKGRKNFTKVCEVNALC